MAAVAATEAFFEEKVGTSDLGRCDYEVIVFTLVCLMAELLVWLVSSCELSKAILLVSQSSSLDEDGTNFRVFFLPTGF